MGGICAATLAASVGHGSRPADPPSLPRFQSSFTPLCMPPAGDAGHVSLGLSLAITRNYPSIFKNRFLVTFRSITAYFRFKQISQHEISQRISATGSEADSMPGVDLQGG